MVVTLVRVLLVGGDIQLVSLADGEILVIDSVSGANLRSFLNSNFVSFQ